MSQRPFTKFYNDYIDKFINRDYLTEIEMRIFFVIYNKTERFNRKCYNFSITYLTNATKYSNKHSIINAVKDMTQRNIIVNYTMPGAKINTYGINTASSQWQKITSDDTVTKEKKPIIQGSDDTVTKEKKPTINTTIFLQGSDGTVTNGSDDTVTISSDGTVTKEKKIIKENILKNNKQMNIDFFNYCMSELENEKINKGG